MQKTQESKPKENYQYSPKRRKLAKIYCKQKFMMSIGEGIILPLIVIATLFFTGSLQSIADWALSFGKIAGLFVFVISIMIITMIVSFPFEVYSSFVYEHKYKLSNQTFWKWFVDYLKGTAISVILGVPLQALIAFLIITTPLWWLYATIVNIVFDIFVNFIYPVLILPILYKLGPYKDKRELKNIFDILRRAGAKDIHKIKVLKESEKSPKLNAFFAGVGRTKMIVLYDNLINAMTKREVRTVIAHELGHYVHKDIRKGTIFDAIKSLFVLFAADKIIRAMFSIQGTGIPLYLVPVISATLIVIGFVVMPISMAYSRKMENAADLFALDYVKDPVAQLSTEKRLADHDLVDDKPHPLFEFWFFSHPSPSNRIKKIYEWVKANKS